MNKIHTIQIKEYDDGEFGFDIPEILEGFTTRPSTVKFYKVEEEGKNIRLTLYDKNKRKIKLRKKLTSRQK